MDGVLWLLREPLCRWSWAEFKYVIVSLPVAIAGFTFTVVTCVLAVVSSAVVVGPLVLRLPVAAAGYLVAAGPGSAALVA